MLLILGALVVASDAGAADWQVTQLPGEPAMRGISCPSTSLCVAVGDDSIATSTEPTASGGSWELTPPPEAGGNLRAISCPSVDLCAAVDFAGEVLTTTDPTGGSGAWTVSELRGGHPASISCPTVSFCVAGGSPGAIWTSTDPRGGTGAWTESQVNGARGRIEGLTCASPTLCLLGNLLVSTEPLAGGASWMDRGELASPTQAGTSGGEIGAVGCADPSLCVAGGLGVVFVSTEPTGPIATWHRAPFNPLFFREGTVAGGMAVKAISCPSTGLCLAATDNGEIAFSHDPTDSAAWSSEKLIGGNQNAFFGLSCPSIELCVAAGAYGRIAVSRDPSAAPLPGTTATVRPPQTILRGRSFRRLRLRGRARTGTVILSFTASGTFAAFECRLDRRPYRPCRSPRAYRLAAGRHAIRIRAVGPGGVDPSPSLARIEVSSRRSRRP